MIFHRHDWHQVSYETYHEDKPHGTFIRTVYYHIEECSKCGQQRKAIFNDWVHKPDSKEHIDDKWVINREAVGWIGHREYEPLNKTKETVKP